jgi:very-short-patch-repair endonuclease
MNPAEDLLAIHLTELGLHFERNYRYVKGRKFAADFAVWQPNPHRRFALIEVQGGIYTRQAHGSITGVRADNTRLYEAFKAGWAVLRFTPQQVMDGEAREMVREYLEG